MYQVNQITADPQQNQTLVLPDGSTISMFMWYSPASQGWFMNLSYETFNLNGVRLCTSPNLLRQFQYQIPFGLFIATTGTNEPTQQQDFASGYSQMFILTPTEVQEYEDFLSEA